MHSMYPIYATVGDEEFNNISRLELSQASESELENLARACDPATFGVNQEDVLDESYRKAKKLDVVNFATKFKLEKSGIMDAVRAALLEGHDSNRQVEAELYKLNVYGEQRKKGASSCTAAWVHSTL